MHFTHKLVIGSAVGAFVLITNAALPYFTLTWVAEAEAETDRAQNLISQAERVLSAVKDAETGQRGYVIAGREEFLEPYNIAVRSIQDLVGELHAAAAFRPGLKAQVADINNNVSHVLEFYASTVDIRKRSGMSPAAEVISSGEGKLRFDRLRQTTGTLIKAESDRLSALRVESERRLVSARAWLISLTLTNLVIFGLGFAVVVRNIRHREEAQRGALAAAEELRASRGIVERNLELSKSQQEQMELLSRMSEALITSRTTQESYVVVEKYGAQLLPRSSGVLSVMHPSRDMLEVVARWNCDHEGEPTFESDACQGLRRGQAYRVDDARRDIVCAHAPINPESARPYICAPMIAQGEVFGLLTVVSADGEPIGHQTELLVVSLAEQLSLALANMRLRETLRRQSIIDPLTGLHNRRFMDETLRRELRRLERRGGVLPVVMADIDHFKRVNDTYGHDAGDAALRLFADTIRHHLRESDLACRYGGEEFLFALPDATLDQAVERAERIRAAVRELQIKHGAVALEPITASFGVAAFPVHGTTADAVIAVADAALYRAKREGRDRVVTAPPA